MSTAHTEGTSADWPSSVTQAIGQRMLQVVLCHVQANDGAINFLWRLNLWCFVAQHISNTKPNTVLKIAVVLSMKWGCVSDTVTYTAIYSCTLTFTLALGKLHISWLVYTHSWHEIIPRCRRSVGTLLSILLSEGTLSHSLERKPAEGKGNMMALAFSTWAKKRISPTFFFFFKPWHH